MKLKVDHLSLSAFGVGIFIVIFAQLSFTFASDTISISNSTLNSNSTLLSNSSTTRQTRHIRVKRDYDYQEGCLIGIRGHLSPGEAEGANLGAFVTASTQLHSHTHSHSQTQQLFRRKRSLSIDVQKNLKLPGFNIPIPRFPRFSFPKFNFGRSSYKSQASTSGNKMFTRTQKKFDVINRNLESAELFLEIVDQHVHSDLSDRILVSPSGITCEDVCDINGQDGVEVSFGIVGVCTSDFCKCHQSDSFIPVGYGWIASPKTYGKKSYNS